MTEQSFMDFIDAVSSAIPAIQPDSNGYVLAVEMDTDYEIHAQCQELGMTAVQAAQHFIEINPNIEAVARELMSGYGVDISDTSFTTASIMRDKGLGMDSQSIADSYAHKRGMTPLDRAAGAGEILGDILSSDDMRICSNAGAAIEEAIGLVEEKDKALAGVSAWLQEYIADYKVEPENDVVKLYQRVCIAHNGVDPLQTEPTFEQGEKATIQQVKKPEGNSNGEMHQEVRVTLSMPADIETESLRARMEMAIAGEFPTAEVMDVEEERHIYGVEDDNIPSPEKEKMAFVLGMVGDISDHKLAALDHGQLKNLITDMRNAAREVMAAPQRGPKLPKI